MEFAGLKRLEPVLVGWLALRWLFDLWPDMPERMIMLFVLRYIPFFIIGMLGYRIWSEQRNWRQQAPYAALVLGTVAATETPDVFIVACLLIATFAALIRGHLHFLAIRPLTWLGGISYSFYLIHQHIGFVVMLKATQAGFGPWTGFLLAILVALVLGTLVNRAVERPAGEAILAWWKRRSPARPAAISPA